MWWEIRGNRRPKGWNLKQRPQERVCPLGALNRVCERTYCNGKHENVVAGRAGVIFVAIVARQGSNADAGASNALPAAPRRLPRCQPRPPLSGGRVTGLPDFSGLVAENGAAVVNISVVEKPQKLEGGAGGASRATMIRCRSSSIVSRADARPDHMPPAHGIGSGFIVTPDGYVLTNAHVVADASEVTVKLTDRREFRAKVIGADKRSDVALIKIPATGSHGAVRRPDKIRPGQWAIAIGSPFGSRQRDRGRGERRGPPLPDDSGTSFVTFIQTDAP